MVDVARALAGLGAAFKNEIPQFQQRIQQEDLYKMKMADMDMARQDADAKREEARKKTFFQDVAVAKQYFDKGDFGSIADIARDRLNILTPMGVNTRDSQQMLQLADAARAGDTSAIQQLKNQLDMSYSVGQLYGVIPKAEVKPNVKLGKGEILLGPDNQQIAANIPSAAGYRPVTADERQQYGLPADSPARWNIEEGKPETMAGGTTINMPSEQKPSVGREAVDKAYAEDYLQWQRVGRSQAFTNLAAIGGVLGQLERGEKLSGPAIGIAPNFILALTNPEATDARETVQGVVQQNLREILGGQFAQQEAQQLLDRAFNPSLDPSINARRLRRLYNQMEIAAKQRDSMANYFDKNESLRGYTGEQPKLSDFYTAVSDFSVDQVVNGFKYLGGDMSDPSSWEEVK
jgi:hypothetical protein